MHNFDYSIKTTVHFGKGQIEKLGQEIKKHSDSVLLVYGRGSVKKNGAYDDTVNQLKEHGIRFVELSGVDPNPKISSVREGVQLCRENKLGAVLAVGGGSVIDCSKVIAGCVGTDGEPWDLVKQAHYDKVLPVFCVLTISATGSEMNLGAVISNPETKQKVGTGHPDMVPVCSILDPTYTFSVSKNQTAAGTADIMSHTFESYFTVDQSAYMVDKFAEGILKTCIKYGMIAINEPKNYEARANLMWASSNALNGTLCMGKAVPFSVHEIEHQLSAYYDITHGVGLAILTPNWMKYILNDKTVSRFVEYGVNVWDIDRSLPPFEIAELAIQKTRECFNNMGLPATLGEVGIDAQYFDEMAEKAYNPGYQYTFQPLTKADIKEIYKMSL